MEGEQRRTCKVGLPSWAVSGPGVSITLEDRPENRYQKTRKRTAWCHDKECAIQSLAISKHGRASHNWPITLSQFRSLRPLEQTGSNAENRSRASRKAKDLVWAMPTAKNDESMSLESRP